MRHFLPCLLLVGLLWGCGDAVGPDSADLLVAKKITAADQLIGGPSARGKLGDYLLANGRVRFIISGEQPSYMGGTFGGTLVDADLQRGRADQRNGAGNDAFSESFPLVNLLVPNPNRPWGPGALTGALAFDSYIDNSGPGGPRATLHVTGSSDYLFTILSFLDKGVLAGYLAKTPNDLGFEVPLVGKLPLHKLIKTILKVDAWGLLSRLQTSLVFDTWYSLGAGERYLTIKTSVRPRWPDAAPEGCPVYECDLCDTGYQYQETSVTVAGSAPPEQRSVMCPTCACAPAGGDMQAFTESENIFQTLLGTLDAWKDPNWKGGLLAGDFVFFGNETDIFCPGIGFDEDRKIFENTWQGVPTLASPLTFDFLAATAAGVSYGWTSANPDAKAPEACGSYRLALTHVTRAQLEDFRTALVEGLGKSEKEADLALRSLLVDRVPIFLSAQDKVFADADAFSAWATGAALDTVLDLADGGSAKASDLFPAANLGVVPAPSCNQARILIPIFSTSATAVLTHKATDAMTKADDKLLDASGAWTFTRYFVVGDGDVGSVLDQVFALRDTPHGRISGVVVDTRNAAPISGASVLAIADPRPSPDAPAFDDYDALVAAARAAFGTEGVLSQMLSDPGEDRVADGSYAGPLAPGRYFLVATHPDFGVSAPVALTVTAGKRYTVHLGLQPRGRVAYTVLSDGGSLTPCKLSVQPLDADGNPRPWDAGNPAELGGGRYSEGVRQVVLSPGGSGTLYLPPGDYRFHASRGFEYSIAVTDVSVRPGQQEKLEFTLTREVDTTGWISGDFHIHSRNSIDSGLPLEKRVLSEASEGVELLASTDHDIITDYGPIVAGLGLRKFVRTIVGVETSTLEYGHFNAFPLRHDITNLPSNGAPAWYGLPMPLVVQALRDLGADGFGPREVIFQANHPRDGMMGYFTALGLHKFDLGRTPGGMGRCNAQTIFTSCDFEALEIINEKGLETVHTPSVAEVAAHSTCMKELNAAATPADVEAACAPQRAAPLADCAARLAAPRPDDADGARAFDHCRWHRDFADATKGLAKTFKDDLIGAKKTAYFAAKTLGLRYYLERTPEEDAAYWAATDAADIGCKLDKAVTGAEPCSSLAAASDDWLRFHRAGFLVTGTGNSDSHDLKKELGLPRNYLQSRSDDPFAADVHQLMTSLREGRLVVSTGPFMTVSIGGRGLGETVAVQAGKTLPLRVRITTPSWFGVERLEVYRNGHLERMLPINVGPEALVDLDLQEDLPAPPEDSSYVFLAYGVGAENSLGPVYRSTALGKMLLPTILGMGAESILLSFQDLAKALESLLGQDLATLLAGALGGSEAPDTYPMYPLVWSNPVRVDLGGDGFTAPDAVDANSDGTADLPAFCSQPCDPTAAPATPGSCPTGESCLELTPGGPTMCGIPIPADCPY
jgi:hypothetical protein